MMRHLPTRKRRAQWREDVKILRYELDDARHELEQYKRAYMTLQASLSDAHTIADKLTQAHLRQIRKYLSSKTEKDLHEQLTEQALMIEEMRKELESHLGAERVQG